MTFPRRQLILIAGLAFALASHAQEWPTKPVRIVVPFAPGGGSDFIARFIATRLQTELGQSFIVENKPGAGGNLGIEIGVKSPPDGYTLTLIASSYTVNPVVYRLKFDPITDVTPVVQLSQGPLIIVANPNLPAKTLPEMVTLAKSKPGALNFASSGTGSIAHAAGELFAERAGIKLAHVPYKGTGPAMTDTMSGQTQLLWNSPASAMPQIQAGKLRALAVTTPRRIAALPDVPTVREAGVPDATVTLWHGLIAPKGTPAAIVSKINSTVAKILRDKETEDKLQQDGVSPAGGSPEDFAATIRNEIEVWKKLSATVNLKVE